jgi:four helix bundle protein
MAGARTFEELDAWGLSVELQERIFKATHTGAAAGDLGFREQVRDSARSAPRNIAEGFGAYEPREFGRFVRIARRSLMETRHLVMEGRTRGYFDEPTAKDLLALCHRALGATTGLLRYLDSCGGKAPSGWGR